MDTIEHIANHIRGYVKARGPCTFVELLATCDDKTEGRTTIYAAPDLVLWEGVNKDFAAAFDQCRADWSIKLVPCDEILYFLDGKTLNHVIVHQPSKSAMKMTQWLPVLISARR